MSAVAVQRPRVQRRLVEGARRVPARQALGLEPAGLVALARLPGTAVVTNAHGDSDPEGAATAGRRVYAQTYLVAIGNKTNIPRSLRLGDNRL
jgi:hypothetical protein